MEERWLWYLAGAIDTGGRIDVAISKNDDYSIGYQISPRISLTRTENYDVIMGMLDEYCEDNGVNYSITTSSKSQTFEISKPEGVKRFLEPLIPRLIQQVEPTRILLEEIIPLMEEGKHTEEEGFLEIMEHVDELRSHLPAARRESKYDLAYFQAEFSE